MCSRIRSFLCVLVSFHEALCVSAFLCSFGEAAGGLGGAERRVKGFLQCCSGRRWDAIETGRGVSGLSQELCQGTFIFWPSKPCHRWRGLGPGLQVVSGSRYTMGETEAGLKAEALGRPRTSHLCEHGLLLRFCFC